MIEMVRGATRFSGDIDGEKIESGYVFVDVSLDKEGQGYGFRSEGMKVEKLEVIDKIKHLPFPFKAELSIEFRATRGKTQTIVIDVKPLIDGRAGQPTQAQRVA
jgi:hypothetical protein